MLDPTLFPDPKFFRNQDFFWIQDFFRPNIFSDPKIFQNQNFLPLSDSLALVKPTYKMLASYCQTSDLGLRLRSKVSTLGRPGV